MEIKKERAYRIPEEVNVEKEIRHQKYGEMKTAEGETLCFMGLESFSRIKEREEVLKIPEVLRQRAQTAYISETRRLTEMQWTWVGRMQEIMREYADLEKGRKVMKELGINSLESLEPKQAIMFVLRMMHHVTKYNTKAISFKKEEINKFSREDQMDAIQLLREGLGRAENDAWDGNGVCRQFADITTLLFEALKRMQKAKKLRNTHCFTVSGWDYQEADLERRAVLVKDSEGLYRWTTSPHAWNMFLQVEEERTRVAMLDPTWAEERDGELVRVDYTRGRTEPIVHAALRSAGRNKEVIAQAGAFYGKRVYETGDQARKYLVWRFIGALPEEGIENIQITDELRRLLNYVVKEHFEENVKGKRREWLRLAEHLKTARKLGLRPEAFIDRFFQQRGSGAEVWIKGIHAEDVGILAALVEEVSYHPAFVEALESSPRMRVFVRTVHPEMLRPWRPHRTQEDLAELKILIAQSSLLETAVKKYLRKKNKTYSLGDLACEDAQEVVRIAEGILRERNEESFTLLRQGMSAWELLRDFHAHWTELGKKNPQTVDQG